ncbi:M1 family metallopeptidase [Roseisolibacter sp. H3M3-2]|uniref:M1 family metallopeptidase n=1 Tax=Roseisolibacter sp. H3M3-2 TaxID=3031323 RepID=UPI0023DABCBA|nr:M1 family metallopeptidase [Roseisolibacter sp. H3M3-2]MDF1504734.1 M1 family metallopeptidase [Roseisolibacter sp. H3M3-2]
MTARLLALALLAGAAALPTATSAQPLAQPLPERAVRRDIPMTNAIRRAHAAGTRDSTGRPGRNYWQLRADYTIEARLDPATSRLTGRETVVIHNASPDSLSAIGLRLDPNVFLGNTPQAATWVPAEVTDGMVITRMRLNGDSVSLGQPAASAEGARAIQNAQAAQAAQARAVPTLLGGRTTNARVTLPTKLAPGARATLEIEWNHKLPGGPGVGHRMTQRWADTLYQPTQWYPRVAKYDDLRGWDPELYLGPSEFYNNFGRFDVKLDVPGGWIVSGTGLLQNPQQVLTARARERLARVLASDSTTVIVGPDEVGPGQATAAGDRLVWHFVADSVNDFAWATAKKFVWAATRATIPEKGRVPIHMVYLPGRANLFRDAGQIARHALEFYSRLWFPYQFPQLTLQDGPSSGMEYPMVINSNRGAADHETAHQWWPMVVGNNETWYGWMDEGFNQYMNILSDADAAGKPAVLDGLGQSYGRTSGSESEPPMMWNANYAGPASYGFTTYSKTPLLLSALGGVVGDSAVVRAHREWARAWMYKHPSPWDYMFFMNRALGRDLGWFWYSWLFATESVDGSIRDVTTSGTRATVTVRQDGQMPSPVVLRVTLAPGGQARAVPNARMLDANTAEVTYPADVWFAGSRTFAATFDFGRGVERVVLDPQCRFPDRDPSDNAWPRGTPPACAAPAR